MLSSRYLGSRAGQGNATRTLSVLYNTEAGEMVTVGFSRLHSGRERGERGDDDVA